MNKRLTILLAAMAIGLQSFAGLQLQQSGGWIESCWMQFTGLSSAYSTYHAYVSADNGASWTALDGELIRSYGTYGRVDAVGLAAGQYKLKAVPVVNGAEQTADAAVSAALTVSAHDRSGFAHTGTYATTGVGAYQNDGTLKPGAKVLYVTAATARTISTNVAGATTNPCVGLQTIIDAYQKGQDQTPICFRIIGKVTKDDLDHISSSAEGLQIKGRNANSVLNITIEGIGNDATVHGFGFLIRNAASVELRNFGIMLCMDDAVSMDTDNDHIWVHHLDLFYGKAGSASDQAKGDGTVDIKSDSKHVTVSYCHFWDSGKSSLCGMTSESGANYITYHHNWFDHSDSRHARVRTMSVHLYNNYYDGNAKYGVGACTGSSVFMEANYFRNCPKPMLISKQGTDVHMGVGTSDQTNGTFSGEAGGIIKSYGNAYSGTYTLVSYQQNATHFDCYEASTRNEQVPSTVTSLLGGNHYDNFDTNSALMYSYTADPASQVPTVVTGALGAGRCQHGDFEFAFTDADDADYAVNNTLKSALTAYTSSLQGIIGAASPNENENEDENEDEDEDENPNPAAPSGSSQYETWFTSSGASNSFYTVSGNMSDRKGTASVTLANGNDTTLAYCVKIESSTTIRFTAPTACTLYIVFGSQDSKYTVKLDDVKQTGANGVLSVSISAGEHVIKKADTGNIFYIALKGIRRLGQNGWATYYSTGNYSVSGATAYIATSMTGSSVVISPVSGIIPGGTAVILHGEEGAFYSIASESGAATASVSGNMLHGTADRTATATLLGSSSYLLALNSSAGEFQQYTGAYFPAGKAYLLYSGSALQAGLRIAEQTTALSEGEAAASATKIFRNGQVLILKNGAVFNLQGMRVK